MREFWRHLYEFIFAPLMRLIAWAGALFSPTVRSGLRVRRGWRVELERLAESWDDDRPRLWFHCASLGEYEQCRPLLEELRRLRGDAVILLVSFFSETPLRHGRWRGLADHAFPLPLDGRRNARRLLEIIEPDLFVTVKFDLWPALVWACRERGVPTALVSAAGHRGSSTAQPLLRGFYRAVYGALDYLGAVSAIDAASLSPLVPRGPGVEVAGDTKFDAVIGRRDVTANPGLELNLTGPVLVCGSTHPPDEERLLPILVGLFDTIDGLGVILAPHHVEENHLSDIEAAAVKLGLPEPRRLTTLNDASEPGCFVLVDTVGQLFELYALADVAYVGGGFHDKGLHNVLEPAAFGAALVYGPRISNSIEARELAARDVAQRVRDASELASTLEKLLDDREYRRGRGDAARAYCEGRSGATKRYLERLTDLAQLPSISEECR
jgi:3-deoxy-D-manno-octulosonic-acid transferase